MHAKSGGTVIFSTILKIGNSPFLRQSIGSQLLVYFDIIEPISTPYHYYTRGLKKKGILMAYGLGPRRKALMVLLLWGVVHAKWALNDPL